MSHIVLTEEQAQILARATGPVEVRDSQGRPLAQCLPLDPDEVAAILRFRQRGSSAEPCIPSAQVQAHLRKLEEISQREELDEARVKDLLRRMHAGEEV